MTKEKLIEILQSILNVEDVEVKDYALESLIESLKELDENFNRKGSE